MLPAENGLFAPDWRIVAAHEVRTTDATLELGRIGGLHRQQSTRFLRDRERCNRSEFLVNTPRVGVQTECVDSKVAYRWPCRSVVCC